MNDLEQIGLLYEAMSVRRTGRKSVNRKDISNFIYQITDGGREVFTVYTIRKNDSKTDPKKKAGSPMVVTGKFGSCAATRQASQFRNPRQDMKYQYKENAVLKMCVTSVDGVNYLKLPAEQRTRSYDVTNITKIEAGGEEYFIV